MYHLMIYLNSDSSLRFDELGLGGRSRHYYLSSSDDVCDVLVSLNHLSDLVYTIEKIDVVSVSDVLKDFKLKEV